MRGAFTINTPRLFDKKILLQIFYYNIDGDIENSIFEPLETKFEDKQVLLCLYLILIQIIII